MVNRKNVEFKTRDGLTLRGWFFTGEGSEAKKPCVVMAHGFSAVKEMMLANFAEEFAKIGISSLVYDNRCLGESDGEPRFELTPVLQIDDYKDAITHVCTLDGVDTDRIGVWGSSYSGGHVLVVAAQDLRVKCCISQVQLIDGFAAFEAFPAEVKEHFAKSFAEDRVARHRGEKPAMMKVTEVLPQPDSKEFFLGFHAANPTNPWRDECTLRSVENFIGYQPGAYIKRIKAPLLLVVALGDALVPAHLAHEAFKTATMEHKKLVDINCGHFEPYEGEHFKPNIKEQLEWLKAHLSPKP